MDADDGSEWSGEPQWKATYITRRVTASNSVVRDRGTPTASWYLAPWEADAVLAEGLEFAALVDRNDPRLPAFVAAHDGPATVTVTCTLCGRTGEEPSDFGDHRSQCPSSSEAAVEEPLPSPQRDLHTAPATSDAWLKAAQSGSLVDGINPGWLSRDSDSLEPWTVELSFDIDARGPQHAEQIAELLATITGGRVSGLSPNPTAP